MTHPPRLESLVDRLALEPLGPRRFRGHTPNDGRPRVFGGLVAAQALVAAGGTVEGKTAHSLHSYFLRPGDPRQPIDYEVDPIRDGASFATRRVIARQGAEAIFEMSASFQVLEGGFEHQLPMPEVPPPEQLLSTAEQLAAIAQRDPSPVFPFLLAVERPIEHRDPDFIPPNAPRVQAGPRAVWFRGDGQLEGEQLIHQAVLTYATDMGLLDNCIQYHGKTWLSPDMMIASLDHIVWYHRPIRADDWLLYVTDSPSANGGRGLNLGRIYDRQGALVASTAQESLMRLKR